MGTRAGVTNPDPGSLDADSGEALDALSARELTQQIRTELERSYTLIISAWKGRVWLSLGYDDWDSYVKQEFGSLSLAPPKDERKAVVTSLREAGMSFTAIEDVTGVPRATAWRDINSASATEEPSTVPFGTVEAEDDATPIMGVNGKSYKASPAARPEPKAATPLFEDIPLSDELLALPPSEMGIGILVPAGAREGRDRQAAAKRMTGSATAPLPMVIRLAGEIALNPGALVPDDASDAEALSALVSDASRGVLALSHVLASIDATVYAGNAGQVAAVSAAVTDAVGELSRFLDDVHSGRS